MLELRHPKYVLLENVDRLLKSPAAQRGRDFAIILSCLFRLGYSVEWRVINAADYGMPQRRRRVYVFAEHDSKKWYNLSEHLLQNGVIARAFPVSVSEKNAAQYEFSISDNPYTVSQDFGKQAKVSLFQNAGVMQDGVVYTVKTDAVFTGNAMTLGSVLVNANQVPKEYWIEEDKLASWQYLKGGKRELRTASNGFEYMYSEGPVAFPDKIDAPSRTILTGEGGKSASRTKHVVMQDGRLRRLVPDELDQLQMFPKGWTNDGMSDGHRAFCMGNALVTGIPHKIGEILANDILA